MGSSLPQTPFCLRFRPEHVCMDVLFLHPDFTGFTFTVHLNCKIKLLHEEREAQPPAPPVTHLPVRSVRYGRQDGALPGQPLRGAALPGHRSPSLRESAN